MFGPSVSARLKTAEQAIEAGRLEDAQTALAAPDLQDQPRAAELRARLAEALLGRARTHEEAGRYAEALRDLDRATEAGATPEQVARLREWVRGVAGREQKADREHRQQVEAARDRIDAGSLAGGREILADLNTADTQVQRLQREAEQRERAAERSIEEARRFVEAGQFGPACRAWERARTDNPKAPALVDIEAQITRGLFDRVRTAAAAGRLDTVGDLLEQLGEVGRALPERTEWQRTLAEAQTAALAVSRADWATARRAVLRLKTRLADAQWVTQAAEQLDQLDELSTAVQAGPLGMTPRPSDTAGSADDTVMLPRANREIGVRPPRDRAVSERSHSVERPATGVSKWQLLVDGAGSYLVLCQDRVTIGRAGGPDAEADIALMADISAVHAEIARVEDDYFLFARKPLLVNGRTVSQRLLENGDKIEFSRHARLTFRLPNRRSASAVLELGGSQRLAGDVRRVVLFDRHATMGPGPGNHVVVPGAYGAVAIFERAGNLYARPASERGTEQPAAEATLLADGAPIEVTGMRMVAKSV